MTDLLGQSPHTCTPGATGCLPAASAPVPAPAARDAAPASPRPAASKLRADARPFTVHWALSKAANATNGQQLANKSTPCLQSSRASPAHPLQIKQCRKPQGATSLVLPANNMVPRHYGPASPHPLQGSGYRASVQLTKERKQQKLADAAKRGDMRRNVLLRNTMATLQAEIREQDRATASALAQKRAQVAAAAAMNSTDMLKPIAPTNPSQRPMPHQQLPHAGGPSSAPTRFGPTSPPAASKLQTSNNYSASRLQTSSNPAVSNPTIGSCGGVWGTMHHQSPWAAPHHPSPGSAASRPPLSKTALAQPERRHSAVITAASRPPLSLTALTQHASPAPMQAPPPHPTHAPQALPWTPLADMRLLGLAGEIQQRLVASGGAGTAVAVVLGEVLARDAADPHPALQHFSPQELLARWVTLQQAMAQWARAQMYSTLASTPPSASAGTPAPSPASGHMPAHPRPPPPAAKPITLLPPASHAPPLMVPGVHESLRRVSLRSGSAPTLTASGGMAVSAPASPGITPRQPCAAEALLTLAQGAAGACRGRSATTHSSSAQGCMMRRAASEGTVLPPASAGVPAAMELGARSASDPLDLLLKAAQVGGALREEGECGGGRQLEEAGAGGVAGAAGGVRCCTS